MPRRLLLLTVLALAACDPRVPDGIGRVEQATVEGGFADRVFGQPSLYEGTEPPVTSERTTHFPAAVGIDVNAGGGSTIVWIADRDAHRMLGVDRNSMAVWYLVGQLNFGDRLPNGGGSVLQTTLHTPSAVAVHFGLVAVADTGNHRVLVGYPTTEGSALRFVFGQRGSFNIAERNNGGSVSADGLADPAGVAIDTGTEPGRLLVSDTGNHRVVIYSLQSSPLSTTAKSCIGQIDCASGLPNRGAGVSRDSLNEPRGIATWNQLGDPLRGFYVVDTGNHRVLHFPLFSSTPDRVYGQGGDFTTAIPSKDGPSARSLRAPTGVTVDRDGSIWVADTGHHRVLHFPKGSTVADRVLGQPNMTSAAPPTAADPTRLRAPEGVTVTATEVFVADTGFSRVLRFNRSCTEAVCDDGDVCSDDVCTSTGCLNSYVTFPRACRGHRCAKAACTPCSAMMPCQGNYQCLDGVCAIRCANDDACVFGGRCVDGFCCDRACDGPCESCNQRGAYGRCVPIEGLPPKGRSCSNSTSECGGRCNGVDGSRCYDALVGSSCGVEACVGGVARARGECRADGTCTAKIQSCAPYGCDVGGCRTSCRWDFECSSGASCVSGACVSGAGIAPSGGCAFGAPTPANSHTPVPPSADPGDFALIAAIALAAATRRKR